MLQGTKTVFLCLLACWLLGACGGRSSTDPPWLRDAGLVDGRPAPRDAAMDAAIDAAPAADLPALDQFVPDDFLLPDLLKPDTWGPCSHPAVASSCANGWCAIPPGCFHMGSPSTEPCRSKDEKLHQVTLSKGFLLPATEVTQTEFKSHTAYNPSGFKTCGASCPVEMVSWHEAAAYCNGLSTKGGLSACYSCVGAGKNVSCKVPVTYLGAKIYSCSGYRLPTEAEQEYAYRAGTTSALYSGNISTCYGNDPNVALISWYDMNSLQKTHPVATKKPNGWGLYDMAGNVREWTHDWYDNDLGSGSVTDPAGPIAGSFKVMRGGGWWDLAWFHRAASRRLEKPAFRSKYIGFRCARTN